MKVLIVHYHLKPGGVSTVIRRQLSALAALEIDAAVLSGEAAPGFGGTVSVEPALGYDTAHSGGAAQAGTGPDAARVAAIAGAIRREADALGEDTVIHVHNPTIRKNSSMLAALAEIAASGRPLVLQVHDLAEDWRPDVYSDQPYPEGALWATINRFDAAALRAAGAGTVAFLPNPVPCPPTVPRAAVARGQGPGLVLCPVRGIRRKNLGEAVLLSLFMRSGGRVGITLPPTSPRDMPRYEAWRALAESLLAPVSFGLGLERGLDVLYGESRAALSTSIKEGFGMSFLEPAAWGRVTLGRRLPRVVPDFEDEGLSFASLYDAIAVPAGLFDEDAFARRIASTVAGALAQYGRKELGMAASVIRYVLAEGGAGADFGRLDEQAQAEVVRSVAGDRLARQSLLAANPFLDGWDEVADALEPFGSAALGPWSEAAYGQRLASLYGESLQNGGGPAPCKEVLLDLYLKPEGFYGTGV